MIRVKTLPGTTDSTAVPSTDFRWITKLCLRVLAIIYKDAENRQLK